MAVRGWGATLATAVGIAAGAGAAQLGFGYGLGIITWTPPDPGAGGSTDTLWAAGLGWATWIAATSTIAGAVGAQRLAERPTTGVHHLRSRPGGIASALAAAVGALVTVLLVAVPARVAIPTDTAAPQTVAAAYAGAGVLAGLLVALWAQRSPPAAANVAASVGWLWLLAVVAVVDGVLAGRGMTSTPLGVWQLTADRPGFWLADLFYWPAAVLSLGSALVIGALAARRAARSTYRRVGAAASGAAGPFLVAVAYLLTAPRLPEVRAEQLSAQLVAAYAVVVGLAGSVLVAALAQRRDAATATADGATAAAEGGTTGAGAPTGTSSDGTTGPDVAGSGPEGAATPALTGGGPDGEPAGFPSPAGSPRPASAGTTPTGEPEPATVPAGEPTGSEAAAAESAAGTSRRRAVKSTSRIPRPRREQPSTGTEPTGSTALAGGTGDSAPAGSATGSAPTAAPHPDVPDEVSEGRPAAGPAAEPRPRGRTARRPRD